MRGVTVTVCGLDIGIHISTHTPHARRDHQRLLSNLKALQFQLTRLMRGVTPTSPSWKLSVYSFQLTRLMRGVTFS